MRLRTWLAGGSVVLCLSCGGGQPPRDMEYPGMKPAIEKDSVVGAGNARGNLEADTLVGDTMAAVTDSVEVHAEKDGSVSVGARSVQEHETGKGEEEQDRDRPARRNASRGARRVRKQVEKERIEPEVKPGNTLGAEQSTGDEENPKARRPRKLSFSDAPKTREEAKRWALAHWEKGKEMLRRDPKAACAHAERGLSLYENGSLFALRAEALRRLGRLNESVSAAQRCIHYPAHWDRGDVVRAYRSKAEALREIAEKRPSRIALRNAEAARREYEALRESR